MRSIHSSTDMKIYFITKQAWRPGKVTTAILIEFLIATRYILATIGNKSHLAKEKEKPYITGREKKIENSWYNLLSLSLIRMIQFKDFK